MRLVFVLSHIWFLGSLLAVTSGYDGTLAAHERSTANALVHRVWHTKEAHVELRPCGHEGHGYQAARVSW